MRFFTLKISDTWMWGNTVGIYVGYCKDHFSIVKSVRSLKYAYPLY